MKTFTINKNDANQRLDKFIRKAFPKISLPSIFKYIRTKKIKVNDKKADISYKVKINDKVSVYLNDDLVSNEVKSNDFLLAKNYLKIVYEDDNIIIVDKPIGVTVQDDNTKNPDTLCNRLLHYLYDKEEWNPSIETTFIPSFVHRLDKNTSGLIIAAKNIDASRILSEKIKNREIDKYYLARVWGIITPKDGLLHAFLTERSNDNIVKITSKPISDDSKEILTEYHTLSHDTDTSVLEVHLITGRKHQIRAHMNYIGHPLVGEKKYTIPSVAKSAKNKYQDLTSYKIVFNFKTSAGILEYLNKKTIKK
ncbi:MAG: RluA family pseudouridine synthase [Mycoplasmoidaceae bacterium]|nr:MAG: RluA family pseudouridine synthase [Mycoplasmoidaceae bacterium]